MARRTSNAVHAAWLQGVDRRRLRPSVPLESAEQQHIIRTTRLVGGFAYVLGTKRPRTDRPSTMQTPGLADLYLFIPVPVFDGERRIGRRWVALWWEVKRQQGGKSKVRTEQREFQQRCVDAEVAHGIGPFDAFLAWLVAHRVVEASSVPHYRVEA